MAGNDIEYGPSVLYKVYGVVVYYKNLERLARMTPIFPQGAAPGGYKRNLALPLNTANRRTTKEDA